MTDDGEFGTTDGVEVSVTENEELTEKEKREQRLEAWAEAGATNFPALLVALGAGAVGGIGILIRRRRRS